MSSEPDKDRLLWSQIFALRTLHEATLQELLGARNYATIQLLSERNSLLRERYLAMDLFFYVAVFLISFLPCFVTGVFC